MPNSHRSGSCQVVLKNANVCLLEILGTLEDALEPFKKIETEAPYGKTLCSSLQQTSILSCEGGQASRHRCTTLLS